MKLVSGPPVGGKGWLFRERQHSFNQLVEEWDKELTSRGDKAFQKGPPAYTPDRAYFYFVPSCMHLTNCLNLAENTV